LGRGAQILRKTKQRVGQGIKDFREDGEGKEPMSCGGERPAKKWGWGRGRIQLKCRRSEKIRKKRNVTQGGGIENIAAKIKG